MSKISWKLATKLTLTALAVAPVAAVSVTAVDVVAGHSPSASVTTAIVYSNDNNNPGPNVMAS